MKWDKDNFLLFWYAAKNQDVNQIIISPTRNIIKKYYQARLRI